VSDAQARDVKAVNHLTVAIAASTTSQSQVEDVRRPLAQVHEDLDKVVNAAQAFVDREDGDAV
jgi:hypothetical protein